LRIFVLPLSFSGAAFQFCLFGNNFGDADMSWTWIWIDVVRSVDHGWVRPIIVVIVSKAACSHSVSYEAHHES